MYSGSRSAANSRTAEPARPRRPVAAGTGHQPRLRRHVGHQPPVSGHVLARDHRGLRHARMRGQHRLDLARLDPEPADLHLLVGPAAERQLPPTRLPFPPHRPLHPVTGPVHPLPRPAERARHEPLRGQPGPARIPAGQPRPGDVQLAGHPGRHRRHPLIQHVRPAVADRGADARHLIRRQRLRHRRAHRALGRPVRVDEAPAGCPPRHLILAQCLARRHQGRDRLRSRGPSTAQHRGGQRHVRHPVPRHHFRQARRRAAAPWPGPPPGRAPEHNASSNSQRWPRRTPPRRTAAPCCCRPPRVARPAPPPGSRCPRGPRRRPSAARSTPTCRSRTPGGPAAATRPGPRPPAQRRHTRPAPPPPPDRPAPPPADREPAVRQQPAASASSSTAWLSASMNAIRSAG